MPVIYFLNNLLQKNNYKQDIGQKKYSIQSIFLLFKPIARLCLLSFCLYTGYIHADQTKNNQKFDYTFLDTSIPVSSSDMNADKVSVIEFFMFKCHHCATLMPLNERLIANKNISFQKMHVVIEVDNKKYFFNCAKTAAIIEYFKLHDLYPLLFKASINDRQDMDNMENLKKFLIKNKEILAAKKVTLKQFMDMYQSFSINNDANQAMMFAKLAKVAATPMFVVAGKYSLFLSNDQNVTYETIAHLVNLELQNRKKQLVNNQKNKINKK